MLSGDGEENSQKKLVGLISKKATLHVQHTFLYFSLPLFCATTSRNFQKLPIYTIYVFLFTSCFRCRSFSPWWSLVFPLFLTAAIKCSCFSSNEIGLLCRSSSFCVIRVNVDIKIKSKERIGFVVVVFIS